MIQNFMINIISFPNDTHFFTVISGVGAALFLGETLSYPFERIYTKMIARDQPKTSGFNIFREIVKVEGVKGLFRGFFTGVGNNWTKNFVQYYIFNILYNNYAFRHIITKKQENKKQTSNPYLKYIDWRYEKTQLCILATTTVGWLISEPRNMLKIKIQGDALGQPGLRQMNHLEEIINFHGQSILKGAFWRRFITDNVKFVGEILLLQYFLISFDYIFQNLHNGASGMHTNFLLPMGFAAASSAAINTFIYPLHQLSVKFAMRRLRNQKSLNIIKHPKYMIQNEGLSILYRGLTTHLIKSISRNVIQIGLLWKITGDQRQKEILNEY